MALVATSLDGPASSWFSSLFETDTQDWSIFSTKFLKRFDSSTIKIKAQAEARNLQLATHESISMYACHVEILVNKRWLEFDSEMINQEYVKIFIHGFPNKLTCMANEKKLDQKLTLDEPVIPFETLKNFVKRKHLAYEMTPKSSNQVKHLELKIFPTNHALKHVFKQTQIKKNHRSLLNSAKSVAKKANLSHHVLKNKLLNIVKSIWNLDNNMVLNLNLLHRKDLKNFSKTIKICKTNVLVILIFLHIKHITVLLSKHIF